MIASQLVVKAVLERLAAKGVTGIPEVTDDNVDDLYVKFIIDDETGLASRTVEEFRKGEFETDITLEVPSYLEDMPLSEACNFESRNVGAKIGDQYVGWTYRWYRGRRSERYYMPWIDSAALLELVETKMVPKMIFKKASS